MELMVLLYTALIFVTPALINAIKKRYTNPSSGWIVFWANIVSIVIGSLLALPHLVKGDFPSVLASITLVFMLSQNMYQYVWKWVKQSTPVTEQEVQTDVQAAEVQAQVTEPVPGQGSA